MSLNDDVIIENIKSLSLTNNSWKLGNVEPWLEFPASWHWLFQWPMSIQLHLYALQCPYLQSGKHCWYDLSYLLQKKKWSPFFLLVFFCCFFLGVGDFLSGNGILGILEFRMEPGDLGLQKMCSNCKNHISRSQFQDLFNIVTYTELCWR